MDILETIGMAKASMGVAYFVTPLQEALASLDGSPDAEITLTENNDAIEIKMDADAPVLETLSYLLLSVAGLDDSDILFEVDASDNRAVVAVKDWSCVTAKKMIDPDDDEDTFVEEDDEEDDGAIDVNTEVLDIAKPKTKTVEGKQLTILTTPQAQKMVSTLYTMCNGEDVSRLPKFWQELDDFCKKYRGESGYTPDEETASVSIPDMDAATAGLHTASALLDAMNAYLVTAKKKGKKKGFKGGRGGLMTVMMRFIAKNGDAFDGAWDSLDVEKLISLLSNMGQSVIEAVVEERDKRGLDEGGESEEEEGSDADESGEGEEVTASEYFHDGDANYQPIALFETRGKRYTIKLYRDLRDGDLTYEELTSGRGTAGGSYPFEQGIKRIKKTLKEAAAIDGITYYKVMDVEDLFPEIKSK